MNQQKQKLNAKVLLFGEHTLLCGSNALSIPFDQFHGELVWPAEKLQDVDSLHSNKQIRLFYNHLCQLKNDGELKFEIDTDRFSKDLDEGLYFESNIPQGYGLGSSGALVAALFKEYGSQQVAENGLSSEQLAELKSFFALLESYFHGKSSGLDPLISYLNRAVLVSNSDSIETITSGWKTENDKGAVFIIDSKTIGETQPLVKKFRKNYQEASFKNAVDKQLIPLVNKSIQAYVSANREELMDTVKELSVFQQENLDWLVPDSVKEIWQKGLDTQDFYLKICGSGGGGMVLGFTKDIEMAQKELGDFSPTIIHYL